MNKRLVVGLMLLTSASLRAEFSLWDEAQTGSDLQRQLQAQQIQTVQAGQQSFLTLALPAMTPFVKGTVILLPDWSQHAASPKAIDYLRQLLPDHGWNTVSMMPPPATVTLSPEDLTLYQQQLLNRMQAVMSNAEKTPGAIIVIAAGHCGAVLNMLYKNGDLKAPQALVLLAAAVLDPQQNELVAQAISQHQVPTLDLLLAEENSYSVSSSRLRLQLVRKHVKEIYRQRLLPGTTSKNHPWLANEVIGWLRYIGY